MRFVTLNLGLGEAAALRRAVEGALGACPCREEPGRARCPECADLETIRNDLHRFAGSGTDHSFASPVADALLTGPNERPGRAAAPLTADLRRRLWIVPAATVDA